MALFNYKIRFGGNHIYITTCKNLGNKHETTLNNFIRYIKKNLYPKSSGRLYQFNTIEVGRSFQVEKEFAHFLTTAFNSNIALPRTFFQSELSIIPFEFKNGIMVKTFDSQVSSEYYIAPYTIDIIFEYLVDKGFSDLIVHNKKYYRTDGKRIWKTKIIEKIDLDIQKDAIAIYFPKYKTKSALNSIEAIIALGADAKEAKDKCTQFEDLSELDEIQLQVNSNKSSIKIIQADFSIISLTPD